jgi:glucuronoarabinoxylan endo-1,4-beta-xylanase
VATGGTVAKGGSSGAGGSSTGGTIGDGGTSAGGTVNTGGRPGGTGGGNAGGARNGGSSGAAGTTPGATGGRNTGGGAGRSSTGAGGVGAGGAGTSPGGGGGPGTGGGGGPGGTTGGVTVQLDQTHQTIDGFGLNTALGGGSVPSSFYSTSGDGLGFTIVRVGMTSSGGLSGSKVSGASKVIGSVWTAPANCKDNNSTTKGGHLLTSCYDSFSTTIASFAKSQGLYAMAAANEPDFASCGSSIGPPCNGDYDTMVFTANEMVAWVKVLGPKLKANNVKLIAPEPSEWIHLWSNTSATGSTVSGHPNSSDPLKCGCFGNDPVTTGCSSTCTSGGGYDYGHWLAKDATAWAAIDIIGTHEYDSQKAMAWPSDVDGGKRSKPVYQTEVSGVMYWPEQGPSSDINNGIAVAGWVHSALVVGEASAWLYWWYQASGSNDNEGLVLSGSTAMTKRCYTIGNYSKFVRPGYVMVSVTGNSSTNLLLSAFTGTDGTVIVGINKSSSAASVPISFAGGTAPGSCTPYVTSSSDNLKAGTAVTVADSSLAASFAGTSVTSYVCK